MNFLNPYRKTVAAVVIGLLGWVGVVVTSPQAAISAPEWLGLGTTLAAALGVYTFSNEPTEKKNA